MHRYFVLPALFLLPAAGCGKKQRAEGGAAKPRTIVVRESHGRSSASTSGTRGPGQAQGASRGVAAGLGSRPELLVLGQTLKKKNYDLSLVGPKKLAQGAKGSYEVVLVPKTPYKVNKLYPHELSFQKVPGTLVVSRRVLGKQDAAVFEPHKLVFRFQVTAKTAGAAVIEGLLKFSVCTPKFCETPKARLVLPLNGAKPRSGRPGGAAASGTSTPPSI